MKQLGCRDLGADCDFIAKGKTDEEIKKKVFRHAEVDHPEMTRDMTPEKRRQLTTRIDEALRGIKPGPAAR